MNSPSILLQRPHKWTDLHLEVGRIRATNGMTAKQILGAKYMPADGEPGMSPLPFVYLLTALLYMELMIGACRV